MKYTKLFQSNFPDFFHFSTKKTLFNCLFSWNICEATRQAWALQAARAYRRQEFWRETHIPLWLLIGRIIFLTIEKKDLSRLWLDVSIFFFTCEKYRSLLWLARSHLRMKIFHIFSVSISQYLYTLYRGDLTLYNN